MFARLQVRKAIAPLAPRRISVITRAVDKAQVLKDVTNIISEQLGMEEGEVTPDRAFVDLGADSLDTVEIMMALEEKFGMDLDEEQAVNITTVQQAADLIAEQIGSK